MNTLYAVELGKMSDIVFFFPTVNNFDNVNILGKP